MLLVGLVERLELALERLGHIMAERPHIKPDRQPEPVTS